MPSRGRGHARFASRAALASPANGYPGAGGRSGAHPAGPASPAAPASRAAVTANGATGARHAAAPRHPWPRSLAALTALVLHVGILVCAGGGIYIAWHQGSAGGGQGGVIAGVALLAAALLRLVLPSWMAGLLAVRHRAIDAVTLVVLGTALLALGVVLPGLGAASAQWRRPADGKGTRKCRRSR